MAEPLIAEIAAGAVFASLAWRCVATPGAPRALPPAAPGRRPWEPSVLLALVVAMLFVNQLVVAVYVDANGGPGFIEPYLGPFWFDVVKGPGIHRAATLLGPRAQWLAPSVLNVQAFLELPFTLLAYLTVARMLGRQTLAPLVRLPVLTLTGLFCTATFITVELWFSSPWTRTDIWLRCASALLSPMALAWLLAGNRLVPAAETPPGLRSLLGFLLGTLGFGVLVLFVYDTCLLYNLAHARFLAPCALGALGLCAAAYVLGRGASSESTASPISALLHRVFAEFTWVFFVPALSLRYVGTSAPVLAGYGLLIAVTFAFVGQGARALPRLGFTVLLALLAALASAGVAAALVTVIPRPYASVFELKLLVGTLVTLGGTALIGRGLERLALCGGLTARG